MHYSVVNTDWRVLNEHNLCLGQNDINVHDIDKEKELQMYPQANELAWLLTNFLINNFENHCRS